MRNLYDAMHTPQISMPANVCCPSTILLPNHREIPVHLYRFIDPEDETGFNKQLVSTFELDES